MKIVNCYDILIYLIKSCQTNNLSETFINGLNGFEEARLGGTYYLLNQFIRQFYDRNKHRGISKNAFDLWKRLKINDSYTNYRYQKPVYYKNSEPVSVKFYIGSNNKPDYEKELIFTNHNDHFRFRQVFHIEHIVPVNVILKELLIRIF